jgi:hypothetical protein
MRGWLTAGLILVLTAGCANDHAMPQGCGDLSWLNQIKEEITAQGRKGEVYANTQGNEPLYLVNGCISCADFPTILYDCRGKALCQSGGISGGNANQCGWPTESVLIWKNY